MPETNGTISHSGEEEGYAYVSEPQSGEVIQESLTYSQNPKIISRAKEIVGTAMREVNRGFVESALDLGQLISSFDIWDIAQDTAPDTWFAYPYYIPPLYRQSQKRGEVIPIYLDENQLRFLRDRSRKLCAENPFAIAAIENRVNYCVGEDGFTIKAVAAPGIELDKEVQRYIDRAQRVIDRWSEFNEISDIEEWLMSQPDINGDAFVRHFFQKSGLVIHRPVECEHIRSPSGSAYGPHYSFGIQTDPHDIMSVEGYWVIDDPIVDQRPTFVPAKEMLHVKRHTPLSAKRGMPLFYSCELLLRSALELLRGVVTTANIRARFAVIRKFTNNVVKEAAQQMVQELQNFSVTDPSSGQVLNVEKKPFGSIINESANVEHEFPSSGMDAQVYEIAMQMVLRAVACRCNMPEWMFTADASNANYSSSLVSEAPSTKSFGKMQKRLVKVVGTNKAKGKESLAWIQIKHAVKCGILAPETLKVVALSCEGPTIVVRDKAGEAMMNQQYFDMKAKSRTMIQQEQGWDPEKVRKQLMEEAQFDIELAALQQEGQIKLQMKAQAETGGGQVYQTQLNPNMQMTDQSQPQQGQDQQQGQEQQGPQLGKQFQPYYEEGSPGKLPSGRAKLEALYEGKGTDDQLAEFKSFLGKLSDKDCDGIAVYFNAGPPALVMIDVMDWGSGEVGKRIGNAAKKCVGKDKIIWQNEGARPSKDKGWIELKCGAGVPKQVSESWEDEQRDALGRWMHAMSSGYPGDLHRVSAGLYQYTRKDGKKFVIIRQEIDSGKKLWHVHEQTGDSVYHHGPPFDAAGTIDEAIRYCEGGISEAKADLAEDLIPGGLADNKPDSDFDADQLKAGIKVEMEHTDDPRKAKEIAKDHLSEDKDYYKKLKKVEEATLHETEGPHSFSSTQFNIQDRCAFVGPKHIDPTVEILKYAMSIPDGALAKDGREGTPHVTVKYGIHAEDFGEVARIVKDFGKVKIVLGEVSCFPANEKQTQRGGDQYDVLKIDVEGEDIHRLNELICKSIECTDTFPVYKPHVTIAYLKPGLAKAYEGSKQFKGWEITFDRLCFSNPDGDKTEICLVRDLENFGDDGHDYSEDKAKPQYGQLSEAFTGSVHIARKKGKGYDLKFVNGKPVRGPREHSRNSVFVPHHYFNDTFHRNLKKFTDKLHLTPMSNEIKEHRKQQMALAMTRMPSRAIDLLDRNVSSVEWFEDQAQLADFVVNDLGHRQNDSAFAEYYEWLSKISKVHGSKQALNIYKNKYEELKAEPTSRVSITDIRGHYEKMRDSLERQGGTGRGIGGAYHSQKKLLCLVGGFKNPGSSISMFGDVNKGDIDPFELYLHEMGHAIDGPDHLISNSQDWHQAWAEDIGDYFNRPEHVLTEYAKENPQEGLAEFCRAVYGQHPKTLDEIANKFPYCSAALMARELWPHHLENL